MTTLPGLSGGIHKSAVISPNDLYRYELVRGDTGPFATFIMLNPSKADADVDDPTIHRCIDFAGRLGCDLRVVNIYALRATDPRKLWQVDAAVRVGPKNDQWLTLAAYLAASADAPLIAAWGASAKPDRVAQVLALPHMDRLQAFGVTKDGHPRHPLYLRADTALVPWPVMS